MKNESLKIMEKLFKPFYGIYKKIKLPNQSKVDKDSSGKTDYEDNISILSEEHKNDKKNSQLISKVVVLDNFVLEDGGENIKIVKEINKNGISEFSKNKNKKKKKRANVKNKATTKKSFKISSKKNKDTSINNNVDKPKYIINKSNDKKEEGIKNKFTLWKQHFRASYTMYAILSLCFISVIIIFLTPNGAINEKVDEKLDIQNWYQTTDASTDNNGTLTLSKQEKKLKNEIISTVSDYSTVCIIGYEILSNRNRVAFVNTKQIADEILDQLKTRYIDIAKKENSKNGETVKIAKCYFEQDVEVQENYLPSVQALPMESADAQLEKIMRGTKQQKRHVIEKGENFWVIAKGYGIPVDTLIHANPDLNPRTLQIGQVISLAVPRPLISVYTVIREEYNDHVPYDVVYEDTNKMYQGEYRTKVKGSRGTKFVKSNAYTLDGVEAGRIIISEKITQEPTTQIVLRGTAPPPPKKGTGTFMRPISGGYVTSGFGWRWGRMHKGVDIGVPIGTPVKASDGGVVKFAGNMSGYGKVVIIDHGANFETRYAHNSKLHVHKGDRVFKGQIIANSGNTGRSTGPHLHFEIRKNGSAINPTKYVSF